MIVGSSLHSGLLVHVADTSQLPEVLFHGLVDLVYEVLVWRKSCPSPQTFGWSLSFVALGCILSVFGQLAKATTG